MSLEDNNEVVIGGTTYNMDEYDILTIPYGADSSWLVEATKLLTLVVEARKNINSDSETTEDSTEEDETKPEDKTEEAKPKE